jgi:hypothetical protein
VILAADGYEPADEVAFAGPGDMIALGVRTIEGFGVAVDNIAHHFAAQTTGVGEVYLQTRPGNRFIRTRSARCSPR